MSLLLAFVFLCQPLTLLASTLDASKAYKESIGIFESEADMKRYILSTKTEKYAYENYSWEEWLDFSPEERMKALQLSEEDLESSTDQLLSSVLSHPYMSYLYAFSDHSDTISHLRGIFNGIDELLDRPDIVKTMIERYIKSDVFEEQFHLGYLLNHKDIYTLMSAKDIISLTDTVQTKHADNTYIKNFLRYAEIMNSPFSESLVTLRAALYIPTAGGNSVYGYTTDNYRDFDAEEQAEVDAGYASDHPTAVKLNGATVHYNCHSYVFYSQFHYSNNVIIPYATHMEGYDNGYYKDADFSTLIPGTTITHWTSGSTSKHSAFFSHKILYTAWFVSKWGNGGLYRHSGLDHPYTPHYSKSYNPR